MKQNSKQQETGLTGRDGLGLLVRSAVLATAAAVLAAPSTGMAQVTSGGVVKDRDTVHTIHIRRPVGYIGITYSGDQKTEVTRNRIIVTYADYPVVVAVEPGSPAQRAGIIAGDTILAFNDRDLRAAPIPLSDIMKPGAKVSVRLRRNSALRTATMDVARRPATAMAIAPTPEGTAFRFVMPNAPLDSAAREDIRRQVKQAHEQVLRELETNRALTERQREQMRRAMDQALRSAAPTRPAAGAPLSLTIGGGVSGVGGAEMTPLNPDLAELVRVQRGVFVVKVNPGTPAEQAGLRSGDVIISVGDSAVTDVAQLRRAINTAQRRVRADGGERTIPMEIVRKQRKRKLALRF